MKGCFQTSSFEAPKTILLTQVTQTCIPELDEARSQTTSMLAQVKALHSEKIIMRSAGIGAAYPTCFEEGPTPGLHIDVCVSQVTAEHSETTL